MRKAVDRLVERSTPVLLAHQTIPKAQNDPHPHHPNPLSPSRLGLQGTALFSPKDLPSLLLLLCTCLSFLNTPSTAALQYNIVVNIAGLIPALSFLWTWLFVTPYRQSYPHIERIHTQKSHASEPAIANKFQRNTTTSLSSRIFFLSCRPTTIVYIQ